MLLKGAVIKLAQTDLLTLILNLVFIMEMPELCYIYSTGFGWPVSHVCFRRPGRKGNQKTMGEPT